MSCASPERRLPSIEITTLIAGEFDLTGAASERSAKIQQACATTDRELERCSDQRSALTAHWPLPEPLQELCFTISGEE